jgi:hypothetical protein
MSEHISNHVLVLKCLVYMCENYFVQISKLESMSIMTIKSMLQEQLKVCVQEIGCCSSTMCRVLNQSINYLSQMVNLAN